MRGLDKNKYWSYYCKSEELIEFKNKQECSPLLYAAKRNNFEFFELLIGQGSKIYTNCHKFMNPLHYAVLNDNQPMIEQLVYADAESNRLMQEKNFRNETPQMLVDKDKYSYIFNHIWHIAS